MSILIGKHHILTQISTESRLWPEAYIIFGDGQKSNFSLILHRPIDWQFRMGSDQKVRKRFLHDYVTLLLECNGQYINIKCPGKIMFWMRIFSHIFCWRQFPWLRQIPMLYIVFLRDCRHLETFSFLRITWNEDIIFNICFLIGN